MSGGCDCVRTGMPEEAFSGWLAVEFWFIFFSLMSHFTVTVNNIMDAIASVSYHTMRWSHIYSSLFTKLVAT